MAFLKTQEAVRAEVLIALGTLPSDPKDFCNFALFALARHIRMLDSRCRVVYNLSNRENGDLTQSSGLFDETLTHPQVVLPLETRPVVGLDS